MKYIIPTLLFIILTISAQGKICAHPLSILNSDTRLLASPDSKAFVASLKTVDWPFEIDVKRVQSAMESFNQTIRDSKPDDNLLLSWAVYESDQKPIFLTFPGAAAYFQATDKTPVLLATIQTSATETLAFFAVNFLVAKNGELEAVIEYIMSPEGNGLAENILHFLKGEFATSFNLKKIYAELEWAGREYWARPQFGFTLSDLQPLSCWNNCETNFIEILRKTFSNYLIKYSLSESDLIVEINGEKIPFVMHNLNSPSDLLSVKKKNGKKVEVNTLRSHNSIRKRSLHVGPAFLLADHRSNSDQADYLTIGAKSYSDSAMPPWFGAIEIPNCEQKLYSPEPILKSKAGNE